MKLIITKKRKLADWRINFCYSNSLKMAHGCWNMSILYVLCILYHEVNQNLFVDDS